MKEILDLAFEIEVVESNKAGNYSFYAVFPVKLIFEEPEKTKKQLRDWVVSELSPTKIFSCRLGIGEEGSIMDWHFFKIHFSSEEDVEKWAIENDIPSYMRNKGGLE